MRSKTRNGQPSPGLQSRWLEGKRDAPDLRRENVSACQTPGSTAVPDLGTGFCGGGRLLLPGLSPFLRPAAPGTLQGEHSDLAERWLKIPSLFASKTSSNNRGQDRGRGMREDAMPCANPGCASQSHWGLPHVKRGSGGLAPEPVVLSDLPAREPPDWPSSSECTKCCRSRVDLPGVDGPWGAWSSLPVASPAMQKWVRSLCFTCAPVG